ncbi:MAG: UDP-N-acetylmuramoyl-L-alanyl-D-glutamate--2,6-diaminopimelate ligase [Thermodesulfobacteriota bacterium]
MADERRKDGTYAVSLQELLKNVTYRATREIAKLAISGVTSDSRAVTAGTLFVAVAGTAVDGHDYIDDAVRRGCAGVVLEKGRRLKTRALPLAIEVADSREALGLIAAAFWQEPARQMTMIGITGTNGKTTSAYLLEELIRQAGGRPGVIGTVNYRYGGKVLPAAHTTPPPETLQRLLREMADSGVTHVIMEVSSHALEQKRVAGLVFDVALFTNLSRDHLDFHGDMEAYYASKKRLFTEYLKPGGSAVVVDALAGDPWGGRLLTELAGGRGEKTPAILRCGLGEGAVALRSAREELSGMVLELHTHQGAMTIHSPLVGAFNVRNLLGVVAVAGALGYGPEAIAAGLQGASGAPGRLERIPSATGIEVFVDYAHTPDALENILRTLRQLARGRLIVVFGCGGDRDQGKRPQMGAIAGHLADVAVVTSDNPRSEEPGAIMAAIEQGLRATGMARRSLAMLQSHPAWQGYEVIPSRKAAIRAAIWHANPGDIVAICGKGHEDYQIVGKSRLFFDDRLVAREMLAMVRW